jgi:hypothetical protein
MREWRRKYYIDNRSRELARANDWRLANKNRFNKRKRDWYSCNAPKERTRNRRKHKADRIALADWYVKARLQKLGCVSAFPRALIEAKRAQLRLHRLAKEKNT